MDATELGRWTRFAAKGGIGMCTALQDCIAEEPEDLMFMKDDVITVLMQLVDNDDVYLGYCEGVVGRFRGESVRFHSRLKKPVMTKRASTAPTASTSKSSLIRPSSSQSAVTLTARDVSPLSSRGSPAPIHPGRSMSQGTSIPGSPDSQNFGRLAPSSVSPRSSPLPIRQTLLDDGNRLRSESHSTMSTGLDSAPTTPADFLRGDDDSVRIVTESGEQPGQLSKLDTEPSLVAGHDGVVETKSSPRTSVHHVTPWWSSSEITDPREQSEDSSYLESEPTRISAALSDGEVGIGLSLLQDFLGGGDGDDGASMMSRRSQARSPDPGEIARSPSPNSPSSTVGGHHVPSVHSVALSGSQYSASPRSIQQPLPEPQKPPSLYTREVSSRNSMHPSVADSSDWGGEDWEGASDIYDQYRYSRYSMASKMSRLSKGSMYTVSSAFDVPPIPSEFSNTVAEAGQSRPSTGRPESVSSQHPPSQSVGLSEKPTSFEDASPTVAIEDVEDEQHHKTAGLDEASTWAGKGKPSPLNLGDTRRISPLLHSAFGSPPESPDPLSVNSFVSPVPSSSSPINPGGIASALRQRLELERGGPRVMSPVVREYKLSDTGTSEMRPLSQAIVVDDDGQEDASQALLFSELSAVTSGIQYGQASEPSGSTASMVRPSEKQQMLAVTNAVTETVPPSYASSSPPPGASPASQSLVAQPYQQKSPQQQPSALPIVRPLNIGRPAADPNARTSLFLPHPHAPKPSSAPTGPMYGRQPLMPAPLHPYHVGPPPGSILHTIHMARATGKPRPTIYARFDHDLASSVGPVPIMFSLEPPMNVPANRPGSVKPARGSLAPTPTASPAPVSVHPPVDSARSPPPGPQQQPSDNVVDGANPVPPGKVIPRANFFPKAGTARPRSRSFSGFDSPFPDVPSPKERSSEEGAMPSKDAAVSLSKRSKSAMATPVAAIAVPAPQRATVSHAASIVRNFHAPSPLSLSQNNVVASSPSPVSPLSPASPKHGSIPTMTGKYAARTSSLGRGTMSITLPNASQQSESQTSLLGEASSPPPSPLPPSSLRPSSLRPLRASGSLPSLRHSRSTNFVSSVSPDAPQRSISSQGRNSRETAMRPLHLAVGHTSSTPESAEPPSPARTAASSRSGLSIPIPRRSTDDRSVYQSDRSPRSTNPSVLDMIPDQKTVQVQDMDFELVQPTIPHSPLPTSSVDSLPLSPIREGTSFPIADRSAPLDTSGAKRSVEQSQAEPQTTKPLEPQDAEMHRQRESKWLNMTTAIPPSQARKSKKVRKLLLEGVPASMRYKVWAHLTDSTAKRMEGIYTRLGQRERVAAIADIERDVPGLFTDRPELQDASLVNLLQAYLTMVPDIQYNRGLAVIAAQLLMLTPEEDAFWTFTSMMDSHLRPYFSSNAIQLEVDASLFGKVVEANDAALAKKIFVDAAIPPVSICRPWFTTLFVDALPSDYFHRVWDIFLFEGITFLFRVGLALLTCCRRALLQSTGQDSVLAILSHPPAASLPPTPEALLELAFSVKVKDDDIRKQRSKLEAQVKRQTQARALSSKPSGTSARGPSISLPRN